MVVNDLWRNGMPVCLEVAGRSGSDGGYALIEQWMVSLDWCVAAEGVSVDGLGAFVEELQRHLEDRPVDAPDRTYRCVWLACTPNTTWTRADFLVLLQTGRRPMWRSLVPGPCAHSRTSVSSCAHAHGEADGVGAPHHGQRASGVQGLASGRGLVCSTASPATGAKTNRQSGGEHAVGAHGRLRAPLHRRVRGALGRRRPRQVPAKHLYPVPCNV